MTAQDAVKDLLEQWHGQRIDRRQLMQRAAALGISASALGAFGVRSNPVAAAQGSSDGDLKLMTTNNEQQATWVRNFNPFGSENSGTRWPTMAGIYGPMMIYNTATGEMTPWLATEYAWSDDNKTLTYTMRDGVMWSDGEPLTAKDVAYTFSLFRDKDGLQSPAGVSTAWDEETGYLSDVQAPDDKTVVFTFSRVFTPALYDVSHQPIAPEHIWKDVEDPSTYANEEPVATGPFTEVAVFQNQIWELHKNPNYWQEGKPAIDGLRLPAYPGNDQINLATLNGELDWTANFIPDIEKTYVSKNPDHFHYWFPATGATVQLYLNTTMAPFDDPNVRKAISHAIDRDQIVQVAMYDYTHPADATGLSDAYEQWKADEALKEGNWVNLDVDQANEMLDAAGLERDGDVRKLPDGTAMEYELNVVSGWTDWVSSCQIMAKNLEDVGIKVSVKTYDFNAWIERVQKGDFTMSIGWSSGGATPFNFYQDTMSKRSVKPLGEIAATNWHRFSSDQATELLTNFAQTSDQDEQEQIAADLQMLYVEDAPAIPLFPGPQWGEYNDTRFTGFPNADNPYALLSTFSLQDRLLVLTTVKPVED